MESEQGLSVRVLFSGACRGNFNKLLKRAEKVHNRNGPFDALFCVGHFFSEDEAIEEGSETLDDEFMQFLNSSQKMPMQTYILGAYGRNSEAARKKMEDADSNVHCLGRSGIFEMPNGLTVAFLEGVYDADQFDREASEARYYTRQDIASLKKTVQTHGGDVDFFLSCEWPRGITNNLLQGSVEELGELPEGSPHIASLLTIIRPRYHVTSQPPLCFTRAPYINPDLGAGPHVTRFTSLCPFGNVMKQNLFALCLTPAQFMAPEKLCEIPPDATDCPFHATSDGKRAADAEVGREAVVVDNSSCTPHTYGVMFPPQQQQQQLQQHLWNQQQMAMSYQQPQAIVGVPDPLHGAQATTDNLGNGVQTLLQNIGRSGSFAGIGGRMDSAPVQCLGSFGGNNFGFSNPLSPQTVFPVNNTSIPQTGASGQSMQINPNLQPYQMNFASSNQPAFASVHSQPMQGDLQNLWMHLAQNPQLLNAAISMGLVQSPLPMTPVISSNAQQVLLANALAKMTVPQQQSHHVPKGQPKKEVDPDIASESVLSEGQTPIPMETERTPFPSPQSKRYKKEGQNRAVHVKDRRKTCFIGRIHPDATRQEIGQFFSRAGEVVHVVLHPSDKGSSSWAFVQFATQEERNRAIQMLDRAFFGGHELIVKPAKLELEFDPNEPVKEWSPASDKALIVSVGQESYVAMDKGAITDDHMLVIPTNHYPNTLRMSTRCYDETQSYLKGLRDLFVSQGRYLLAFERYLLIPRLHGNHTHISAISIDKHAAQRAKETFIQRGQMQTGEWNFLSPEEGSRENVHDLVGDEEYLLVILPDGSKLVRPMFKKDRLPVSFGRDVMAELAGIPERADWKLCLSSESEEKMKVERFKTQFRAFDYPNQG